MFKNAVKGVIRITKDTIRYLKRIFFGVRNSKDSLTSQKITFGISDPIFESVRQSLAKKDVRVVYLRPRRHSKTYLMSQLTGGVNDGRESVWNRTGN